MPIRLNIINTSRQQFNFTVGGEALQVNLDFNTTANAWFVGLMSNGLVVFQGRKLVARVDIAVDFTEGTLYGKDASNNSVDIGYEDLIAGNSRLYYYTKEEIAGLGARSVETLEELTDLPANFVDGGSIGVPLTDFAALQNTVTQQAGIMETLGNAITNLTQTVNTLQNTITTNELSISKLKLRSVGFSFSDAIESNSFLAEWVSTKNYVLKASSANATGQHRGTATVPAGQGNAVVEIRRGNTAGDSTLMGTVVYGPTLTVGTFTILQDFNINPGDSIELHALELFELSDVAVTLQLEELL